MMGKLSSKTTGLAIVRTAVRIQVMASPRYEYELLTFILPPTARTSLKPRRFVK